MLIRARALYAMVIIANDECCADRSRGSLAECRREANKVAGSMRSTGLQQIDRTRTRKRTIISYCGATV